MTSDPDLIVKEVYAERARQDNINQRWDNLSEYRQDYWRGLVNLVLAVQERLMAEGAMG